MANATLVLQRFLGRDSLQQLAGPGVLVAIGRRRGFKLRQSMQAGAS